VRPENGDFQVYSGHSVRAKPPPHFVNEAEAECARILDFHGIQWEYEPHSFVLEEDEEGRVLEAFTPDFYLPEQRCYLEVTVMKQSLITRKNRKIRKFRERYPDIKIKLFTRRDFERLAQKYGLNLAS
jgi:hypoxanthine phosphoribosyltransferase